MKWKEMTETEEYIRKKTEKYRTDTSLILCFFSIGLLIILGLVYWLYPQKELLLYLLGIFMSLCGLTVRCFRLRKEVDTVLSCNTKLGAQVEHKPFPMIYDFKSQKKLVKESYYYKYLPTIILYSLIIVSLVILFFDRGLEKIYIDIMFISAFSLIVGFTVKWQNFI